MRFLTVRELRNRPGKVWGSLAVDDIVVISNGRPVGLLIGVDDTSLEATLETVRRARAQAAVTRMRQSAEASGRATMTPRAIDAEIRRARRRP